MIIPYQSLASETLRNLIEEFVTRDGTDYGAYDLTMDDKVKSVEHRLRSEEVVILYLESSESVNIVEKQSLNISAPNSYENNSNESNSYEGDSYKGESYEGESYESDSYKGDSYKGDSYKGDSYENNSSEKNSY